MTKTAGNRKVIAARTNSLQKNPGILARASSFGFRRFPALRTSLQGVTFIRNDRFCAGRSILKQGRPTLLPDCLAADNNNGDQQLGSSGVTPAPLVRPRLFGLPWFHAISEKPQSLFPQKHSPQKTHLAKRAPVFIEVFSSLSLWYARWIVRQVTSMGWSLPFKFAQGLLAVSWSRWSGVDHRGVSLSTEHSPLATLDFESDRGIVELFSEIFTKDVHNVDGCVNYIAAGV